MYKLILFDFDGTVIDGSEGIYNCINYALEQMNKPKQDEVILRKFIGPSLYDSYMQLIEESPENAELFMKKYRERYAPVGYAECKAYDGIPELLKKLRDDGYEVGVCSSKPLEFVKKISALLGIFDLFTYYACPDFAATKSEKDELITEAAGFYGVSTDKVLMIGDRHFDIDAAKAAGTASMGVRYGFSEPGELEEAGADIIAETVEDIYTFIKETE